MTTNLLCFWLILTPLVIIGLIDDLRSVPASIRYFVQLAVAGIAINCFTIFPQPWLTNLGMVGIVVAIILTVIGFTALINFYNFMDGLDGLVAGVTAVQLGFIAIYFNQPGWWVLVAALLGFLRWNWSPAQIFMGDVGSTFLGASVAIALLNSGTDLTHSWSALAITLPISADAVYTLISRLIKRENIFQAHRSHLYQRLQQSGWSHAQVATAYILMTLLIGSMVTCFGLIGAGMSLCVVIVAFTVGELYLNTRLLVS